MLAMFSTSLEEFAKQLFPKILFLLTLSSVAYPFPHAPPTLGFLVFGSLGGHNCSSLVADCLWRQQGQGSRQSGRQTLNKREWLPTLKHKAGRAPGAQEQSPGQDWNWSFAACSLSLYLFGPIGRGRRDRRWEPGPGVAGLNTKSGEGPFQFRHSSGLQTSSYIKRVHFGEGKKVLLTTKLDNRHSPTLSQMVTLSMATGGRGDNQEPWR